MLCKLLLFAILVSVCGGNPNVRVKVIGDSVASAPISPISAGKNGVSRVVQPPQRIRLPMPPSHPYPGPLPPMSNDYRRQPCPPFDLPSPTEVMEPSGGDGATLDPIKQCQVGCWIKLDNLRFSCKVIGDDMVKEWYAKCLKDCFESNGEHIDFELWQAE